MTYEEMAVYTNAIFESLPSPEEFARMIREVGKSQQSEESGRRE